MKKQGKGWRGRRWAGFLALALALALAACESTPSTGEKEEKKDEGPPINRRDRGPSMFGEGGLTLFGGDKKKKTEDGTGVAVNSFLWRASLDTVSFLPMSSADPFGGVIITDWYSPSDSPNERFKINVFILSRGLRADGIRVSVFRQVVDGGGGWRDAPVPEKMNLDIEDAILTKARELRNETMVQ